MREYVILLVSLGMLALLDSGFCWTDDECGITVNITTTPVGKTYFKTGKKMELSCNVGKANVKSIQWKMTDGSTKYDRITSRPNIQVAGNRDLEIEPVKDADEGDYWCQIETENGWYKIRSAPISLIKASLTSTVAYVQDISVEKGNSKRIDPGFKSTPPGKCDWRIQENEHSSNFEPFKTDERVRRGADSSIYFLKAEKRDEKPNKIYLCQATNGISDPVKGNRFRLEVEGDAESTYEPEELYVSGKNGAMVVREGKRRVYLECFFGGNPIPEIKWKYPAHIESRVKRLEQGSVLQIENVTREDAGQYSCIVSSDILETDLTRDIHLVVEGDKPKTPLVVGKKYDGDTVVKMNCTTKEKKASHKIRWFIDGNEPNQAGMKVEINDDDLLEIRNFNGTQNHTVQCSRGNDNGETMSDAFQLNDKSWNCMKAGAGALVPTTVVMLIAMIVAYLERHL